MIFFSHHGHCKHTRKPFGLKWHQHRFVERCTSYKSLWSGSTLLSVSTISSSSRRHQKNIHSTPVRFHCSSRTQKWPSSWCFIFSKPIEYLRHVIVPGQLQVAQRTTEATKIVQYPTTVSKMRSPLGLCICTQLCESPLATQLEVVEGNTPTVRAGWRGARRSGLTQENARHFTLLNIATTYRTVNSGHWRMWQTCGMRFITRTEK